MPNPAASADVRSSRWYRSVAVAFLAAIPVVAALPAPASTTVPAALRPDGSVAEAPEGEWIGGDTHIHTDHSSDGSLTRQGTDQRGPGTVAVADQIDAAERNQISYMPLSDHRSYDGVWNPQFTSDEVLLIPGEEAQGSPHITVQGTVDNVVDGANPPESPPFRHMQQNLWDGHAQDANWSTAHPDSGFVDGGVGIDPDGSAVGFDVAEVLNRAKDPDAEMAYAENRWNRGMRFGIVGASDTHNRDDTGEAGPGDPTTFVLAADRTERAILDGLRRGHTTVTDRPDAALAVLEGDLDGDGTFEALGGDEILSTAGVEATLRIRVERGLGTTVLLYGSPGREAGPVATFQPTAASQTYDVPVVLADGHSWYRVELRAPGQPAGLTADASLADQLKGGTSPIFVSTTGAPAEAAPEIPLPAPLGLRDAAVAVVGEAGGFAGFPDLARSDGVGHLVAEQHLDATTAVTYRRLVDGEAPGVPVDLAPNSDAARFPRVAARGADVWVTWQDERSGQLPRRPDVYVRHSSDGGLTWEPERRVTEGRGRAEQPVVEIGADGGPVVAWHDSSGGVFDVVVQALDVDPAPVNLTRAGKEVRDQLPGDSRTLRAPASLFPSLTVDPAGRVVVVWHDNRFDPDPLFTGRTASPEDTEPDGTNPDDWEVLASGRDPGGEWSAPARVGADPAGADRHPSVVADASGALVAVWETKELKAAGVNLSLRSSRSTDGGLTWSAPEPVGLEPETMSERAEVGVDPDGRVRAVWYDSRSTDWRWSVQTAVLGAAGWSAAERVTGDGNATWPALSDGAVAFTSDRAKVREQRDPTHQVLLLDLVARGRSGPAPGDEGSETTGGPASGGASSEAATASGAAPGPPEPASSDAQASPSPSPGAATTDADADAVSVQRLAGAERISTAVEISSASFAAGEAEAVVVARADGFADALTGAPLAVAEAAPLLLSYPDRLDAGVEAEIARALGGTGRVVVLGGDEALSPAVADRLAELGHDVTRVAGANRFATAVAVAEELPQPQAVVLATGNDFADALAGGAAAAARGDALLLTADGSLPPETADHLSRLSGTEVFALGGPAAEAVPDATPVVGADRHETAVLAARALLPRPEQVGLATGAQFPDALAGGAAAGRAGAPVLLAGVEELPEAVDDYLRERPGPHRATVFGGPNAVGEAVLDQIEAALRAP